MKIVKTLLAVTGLVLLLFSYAFAESSGYMRVSHIEGDVQVHAADAEEWGFAALNSPLGEGDQVWIPEGGRAELQLDSGTFIRLDQNSALQILSVENGSSQFHLSQGSAYIVFDVSRKGGVIQFDTPDASTRAYKRAIFRIDIYDQYTDVAVYRGSVETENGVGRTKIRKDRMLSLGQDTDGEVSPMGPPDEWETWNKRRNDRIFSGTGGGSRYLPEELRSYSNDFDDNGKWVQVPDYGYVWTPTVVIGTDWAPYRHGRWIWRHGEYVWVGHEPWGWAPYHYGRWAHIPRIGWGWVPPSRGEVFWGPGFVGWVRTAEYVAWVPLAPRETYYGRGHHGRHSVDTRKVNINQINITNVYQNIHVNNGVTVVNRNTFNTAAPAIVNVRRDDIQKKIFVKQNVMAGAPDIRPAKGSYFASPRAVAPAQLPPQPVRNVTVKELKNARPFTKDAARSVLNPGVKPAQLPVNTVVKPRTAGMDKPVIQPVRTTGQATAVIPEKGKTPRTGAHITGKPVEKDKGRAVMPAGAPAMKDEKPVTRPERKATGPEGTAAPRSVEPARVQPADKGRAVMPTGAPAMKDEKPVTRPERKATGPEGTAAPRSVEPARVQPADKGRAVMPAGAPAMKDEKPVTRPERKATGPQGTAAPRSVEPARVQPADKGRAVMPAGAPAMKDEKPVTRPERKATGPEGTAAPRSVEPARVQPADKGRAVMPAASSAPKAEKPAVKPVEKARPVVAPAVTGAKDAKPRDKDKKDPKDNKDKETDGTPGSTGGQPRVR